MMNAIREGGWPMYVVLLCGAASLGAAIGYARSMRRELVAAVVGLGVATLLAGAFGTVAGVMVSIDHIVDVPADQRWIVLIGLKESLNNIGLAIVFAFLDSLLITRGLWRRARLMPQSV